MLRRLARVASERVMGVGSSQASSPALPPCARAELVVVRSRPCTLDSLKSAGSLALCERLGSH